MFNKTRQSQRDRYVLSNMEHLILSTQKAIGMKWLLWDWIIAFRDWMLCSTGNMVLWSLHLLNIMISGKMSLWLYSELKLWLLKYSLRDRDKGKVLGVTGVMRKCICVPGRSLWIILFLFMLTESKIK